MKTKIKIILTLALFLCCAMAPVARADIKTDTTLVETYLNGLTTLKARFIQTANNGEQAAGDFLLKRPGRMRFEYDAPIKDFIVADGLFVYYYDGAMKQQSNVPVSQSLADFFLRDELSLSGDIGVTDTRREKGMILLTLTQKADPLAGTMTLALSESPLQLKSWRIVDGQGAVTEVELFEIESGMKLKNDLFKYYDPELKKTKFN